VKVTDLTKNSATISWNTSTDATSKVEYGEDSEDAQTLSEEDQDLKKVHSLKLTGLSPGTRYYFKIISADEAGNTATSGGQSFETSEAEEVESASTTADESDEEKPAEEGSIPWLPIVLGLLVIGAAGTGLWWYFRKRRGGGGGGSSSSGGYGLSLKK
jgi:hypothetical protein